MLVQLEEPGTNRANTKEKAKLAIGIDLGTTNSVAAWVNPATHKVEMLTELIPSILYWEEHAPRIGTPTSERATTGALSSTKTLMGTPDHLFTTPTGDHISPVGVAAEILKHIKTQAQNHLDQEIDAAVITVPAYFDETQRQATKHAAELAGLEVLRLVSEPTAAALAYGLDAEEQSHELEGLYVVFDLGGGTFDLSLLKLHRGVFQVLATSGDTHLGGDDFDKALVAYIEQKLSFEFYDYQAALQKARKARHHLSASQNVVRQDTSETALFEQEGQSIPLTPKDLENASLSLTKRILTCCRDIEHTLQEQSETLKGVILVGGATRMPLIRNLAEGFFDLSVLTDLDPDRIVALGAARQAHALTHGSSTLLLDVTPLSLGLELMGGMVDRIIERNTPIPCAKAKEFTTYKENQTGLVIHVVQGEREMVQDCQSLARFEINGIPPMQAGVARVLVTFRIDADGLLTVSAQEKTTGITQEIVVRPTHGLSQEDMQTMVISSLEHAEEDVQARKLAQAKTDAGRMVEALLPALTQSRDLLSDQEYQDILNRLDALDQSLASGDPDLIEEATKKLEEGTQEFASKRMTQDIKKALAGQMLDEVEKNV